MEKTYDFCGWATRNDVKCSDGRTIRKDAFKHNDGKIVPLVWNHQHDSLDNVLGHALLENRDEGVYAYCTFNDTENGELAKVLVKHGDIKQLSIYASQLKQQGPQDNRDVLHGELIEVSLVHGGANPGAFIDSVFAHSVTGEPFVSEDEGKIYTGEDFALYHAEEQKAESKAEPKDESKEKEEQKTEESDKKEETVQEVFDSMSEKQQNVVYAIIGQMAEDLENKKGDDKEMKQNVFDKETHEDNTLSHAAVQTIIKDGKKYGSLKESFLAHATEYATGDQDYGVIGTDWLFPEDRNLNSPPEFIKRDTGWVSVVMNGVHHSPFSRIKSMFADLREEDARAKGYIKGKFKKEEVFSLLKRSTSPTTVYKKQKMDRDDIIDITDFNVVAWIKGEMRMMLDEELARAYLVGDGRLASSDDKIDENCIRPIWTDEDLFTIKATVTVASNATEDEKAKAFIRTAVKSRKEYKGSGNPVMFTTEDNLTDMLLLEDSIGHRLYKTVEELKAALRVSNIVTVPVMENLTRTDSDNKTRTLKALVINLKDYNVGADKGGAISMFEDFDIDYNQEKYLIETRCSGALTKPFSAIAIEEIVGA